MTQEPGPMGEGGPTPAKGSARVTPASPATASGGTVYGKPPAPADPESTRPSPQGRARVPLHEVSPAPAPHPAAPPTAPSTTPPAPAGQPGHVPSPISPSGVAAPGPASHHTAPTAPGTPPVRPPRRKRLLAAVLLPVFLLLALGAGTATQLRRALPAAALATDVAATLRIPGEPPALPWPAAGSAELMIEGLGRLGGARSDRPAPIGSVAKVMTAYVVLKNHPLEGDDEGPSLTVTAADVADFKARVPSGQSLVEVRLGEKMTQRDALEALMLPSANNVARMLAIWDGGDEASFVASMNAAAAELGMTDTSYSDPSGFLPTTISTASDQVKLARAALRMEVFAEIVALEKATIPVAGTVRNYNGLLGENGVFGIKTGSTDEAGGNLLFAANLTVGKRKLVIVGAVFNQPGARTPQQLAKVNTEVRRLLTGVRRVVREYPLLGTGPVGTVRTAWGETAPVTPATSLRVVGWPGLTVPVEVTTSAPGASVSAGQVVGAVRAADVRVDLTATATTPGPTFWWKVTRRP
jgi:serine-type D-Ala-D-Ala carboxypeptidase (penicillin-binding protein 5/6)